MTVVVNNYGGPGTGKSTTAAKVFAELKDRGQNAELVTEYVKGWAWEGRKPTGYDQFYLYAKQARREQILYGKVDFVVTDSPVVLCGVYASLYGTPGQAEAMHKLVQLHLDEASDNGVEHVHVFLRRTKAYNPVGRFQTEEQAREIDDAIEDYMGRLGVSYYDFDCKPGVEQIIVTGVLDA
jgi:hypothetical protein